MVTHLTLSQHAVSPKSRGLIHKAIVQSGTGSMPAFFRPRAQAEAWSDVWIEFTACNGTRGEGLKQCLLEQPWQALAQTQVPVAVAEKVKGAENVPVFTWFYVVDDESADATVEMRRTPTAAIADATVEMRRTPTAAIVAGEWNEIPLLLGTNSNEGSLLATYGPELFPDVEWVEPMTRDEAGMMMQKQLTREEYAAVSSSELYQWDRYPSPQSVVSAVITDKVFNHEAIKLAAAVASQGVTAQLYYFDLQWDDSSFKEIGNTHGWELPFVWRYFMYTSRVRDLADVMGNYWFADWVGGRRTNSSLEPWPAYSPDRRLTLVLDSPSYVGRDVRMDRFRFWDQLLA